MQFEVLGLDYDRRIECFMINARADYEWYLTKTQGSEANLAIQRDVIKGTKPYRTLRADLKLGCVLPTIVLAARDVDLEPTKKYDITDGFIQATADDLAALTKAIEATTPADIDIVDGLQRTNALRQTLGDLEGDAKTTFLGRSLRLEIWVGIPFYSLAYRMLLLNAGQKPMSMKHQIDILSRGLADDLKDLPGIEIITIKDHKRRVKPGQFHLSTLAQAFQAWLQRNPNVDVSNMVVETLIVDEALETLGVDLQSGDGGSHRDSFREFVTWLIALDNIFGDENNRFLGNDTVVLGIAAAVGFAYKNEQLRDRVQPAMDNLLTEAKNNPEDPIGINSFDELRRSIDTRRSNVGEATREFVFRAIREYIMQSGTSSMTDCWTQSATMI
jgi:hypothetical protein